MGQELIAEQGGQRFGVVTRVARQLGIGTESLSGWLKQATPRSDDDRGVTRGSQLVAVLWVGALLLWVTSRRDLARAARNRAKWDVPTQARLGSLGLLPRVARRDPYRPR